jgi:preprotein translocase subunit YajC
MSSILPVFAQAAAAAPAGGGLQILLLQFGLIFAIFYFLMIRPQQKQRKQHEAALMGPSKGDSIVTAGGLVGEVVHIKDGYKDGTPAKTLEDHVTVRSGESKVVVERGRIAKVIGNSGTSTQS